MKHLVSSLILLFYVNGFAQLPASPQLSEQKTDQQNDLKKRVHYSFPHNKKNEKNFAELKLTSQKNGILLDLETTGLKKGQYKIVVTDKCKASSSSLKLKFISEIYSFQTEYGEVSSEDNLPSSLVSVLNSQDKQIAILKMNQNKFQIVACGILQSSE